MEEELEIIKNSKQVPKILLHSCCAPCSTHVIDTLAPFFDITIIYYNPNIEPFLEYKKRKNEEIRFINEYKSPNKLSIIDSDYDNHKFKEISKGLEDIPEGGNRCLKCYLLRLEKTAQIASKNQFDYFTTTLTVSPLKNSSKINDIGHILSEKYHIKYLYSDFKKKEGYKHSIKMAQEYGLYRQDYCGCIFSKAQRAKEKAIKANKN